MTKCGIRARAAVTVSRKGEAPPPASLAVTARMLAEVAEVVAEVVAVGVAAAAVPGHTFTRGRSLRMPRRLLGAVVGANARMGTVAGTAMGQVRKGTSQSEKMGSYVCERVSMLR